MIMDNNSNNFGQSLGAPSALETSSTDVSFEPFMLVTPTHRSPPKSGDDALNTPSVTSATSDNQTFFPSTGEAFPPESAESSPNLIGKHR